jgi:hypothetical protein
MKMKAWVQLCDVIIGLKVCHSIFLTAAINLMKILDLRIEQKLDYKLEKEISDHSASVPLSYYDNNEFHHHRTVPVLPHFRV